MSDLISIIQPTDAAPPPPAEELSSTELPSEEIVSQALTLARNFSQTRTGDQDVDALLSLLKWDTPTLTFGFPDDPADYASPYHGRISPDREVDTGFAPAPPAVQAAMRAAIGQVQDVTGLTFSEVSDSTPDIAIAVSGAANLFDGHPAYTYSPGADASSGDVWIAAQDTSVTPPVLSTDLQPLRGDHGWHTALHEFGHALGLKHPGESQGTFFDLSPLFRGAPPGSHIISLGGNPVIARTERDSLEFSVMSQRSYVGAPTDHYSNERFGYPQTLMMDDIRALQEMYGANFETRSGDTAYRFDAVTGEVTIDGVGQGAPGANNLFLTIWDGGGTDTYDFSGYSSNLTVDLSPGGWSVTSAEQLAYLGDGEFSRGNVFNALQFRGDPRSLIENATGGSGNDRIAGNVANNELFGAAGNDALVGRDGSDTLTGDLSNLNGLSTGGRDQLFGGPGNDTLIGDALTMSEFATGGVDFLDGGDGDDSLRGDAITLSDFARGGDDRSSGGLFGGAGSDNLIGDATIMRGNTIGGGDELFGGPGDDVLIGDAALMSGNAHGGGDRLDGGPGNDRLSGDAMLPLMETAQGGPDTFIFADAFGNDTIGDFRQGEDRLEFHINGITANTDLMIAAENGNTTITAGSSGTVVLMGFSGPLTIGDTLFV